MAASDPAFDSLFELWIPGNSAKQWRVRFMDGGIAVFTDLLAHEDEQGQRQGTGKVVRQMRPSKDREWTAGQETWFDLSEIKDVADPEVGNIVFPPGAFARKPLLNLRPSGKTKAHLRITGLALLGLLALAGGVADQVASNTPRKWPTAPAIITSIEIDAVRSTASRRLTHPFEFSPVVTYWYAVDGIRRSGTIVTYSATTKFSSREARRLIPFDVGDTVPAHVNPANPSEAEIRLDDRNPRAVLLFAVAAILLAGAFLWWHSTVPQRPGVDD